MPSANWTKPLGLNHITGVSLTASGYIASTAADASTVVVRVQPSEINALMVALASFEFDVP